MNSKIEHHKKIVIDLDGTITANDHSDYANVSPNIPVIEKLREYSKNGYYIVVYTARNMKTHEGNIGKINIYTLPVIMQWLAKHEVPFDEIIVGKPWCGHDGFYVDDRAIRPSEFVKMSESEIRNIME